MKNYEELIDYEELIEYIRMIKNVMNNHISVHLRFSNQNLT